MPRPLIAAALAVLFAAQPAAAATLPCQTPAELAAMRLRQLQVELMVAALNCHGASFDYRGTYAIFIRNTRPDLARNAQQLQAMFTRAGMGDGAIDHYQTELSNRAQVKSLSDQDYCGHLASIMADAARLPPTELGTYAARMIPAPLGAKACPAPVREAADQRPPLLTSASGGHARIHCGQ